MKKIITFALALIMVFTLAACGGKTDPAQSDGGTQQTQNGAENPGDAALDIDFDAIMAGNGDTDIILGQQDAANRQAILDAAKENGLDASFGADGSFTLTDPESGDTFVQKSDGTWTIQSEDGGEGQVGGNWPDNEYTKLVPKPDFTLTGAYVDSDGFTASFTDATLEQIRDYAEKVKAKGFTIDPEIVDQSIQGVTVFSYAALNANGYRVQIVMSAGESGITITAP